MESIISLNAAIRLDTPQLNGTGMGVANRSTAHRDEDRRHELLFAAHVVGLLNLSEYEGLGWEPPQSA